MFLHAIFLFLAALLTALVEIEIEGPLGWAERTQTWYRTRGKIIRPLTSLTGKPLTGYHLALIALVVLVFHEPFFAGARWSLTAELTTLSTLLIWTTLWDFLWFLFNPAYGWQRFRQGNIWWHHRWIGRLPVDYAIALVLSVLLAVAAGSWHSYVEVLAWLAGLTVVACAFVPLYRKIYRQLRESDDRATASTPARLKTTGKKSPRTQTGN